MTFYEFYAMGVPLFMPSHLSKYLFPFSASVPLLDWVPKRIAMQGGRPPYSSVEHDDLGGTSVLVELY